ncbi:MAG: bacteriophage T4 gp5 trimerization domain-containing protein [Escherichia sp.]
MRTTVRRGACRDEDADTIRSKTYKGSGFNELRFEDATGGEQVYIHARRTWIRRC